jgi:hypothetical protein
MVERRHEEQNLAASRRRPDKTESARSLAGRFRFSICIRCKYVVACFHSFLDDLWRRWKHHEAGPHFVYFVSAEHEFNADTKVLSCAAQSPEEVLILVCGGFDDTAICQDDRARKEVVDNQPVFDCEPTKATAEREATDTGI